MKYKIGDMFILDGDRGRDRAIVIIIGEYRCKHTNNVWHVVEYNYLTSTASNITEGLRGDDDIDIMINRDKFTYIPA